jgi:arylsulfatase A-like enzyme
LAGIPIPDGLDAKSLAPILTGKQPKVRDLLYTGYRNCQRSVRDDRWKLIRYPLIDKTQLFDLQADPHEMNDLAAKPESAPKVAELMKKLQTEMEHYNDKSRLVVPNPKSPEWTPADAKPKIKKKK